MSYIDSYRKQGTFCSFACFTGRLTKDIIPYSRTSTYININSSCRIFLIFLKFVVKVLAKT